MKTLLFLLALVVSSVALAQTGGEQRGSAPLGTAQDGSRPADGAIKGGTIAPGESGGMPERTPNRCYELKDTLREDCLKQQQERGGAAGGASRLPDPRPSDSRTRSRERAD